MDLPTALIIGGALLLSAALLIGIGLLHRRIIRQRERDGHSGPESAALLRRLGLAGLVRNASGITTWSQAGRNLTAARTDGRGWATSRGGGNIRIETRLTISGLSYSLVAVQLPAALPTINIVKGGRIERSDLDVESARFNSARDVMADDDQLAHAVLSPNVIALLQDLPKDLTVQIIGDQLISFRRGRPDPAEVRDRAATLIAIAEAIPDFVFRRG